MISYNNIAIGVLTLLVVVFTTATGVAGERPGQTATAQSTTDATPVVANATGTADDDTITEIASYSLTPDRPGEIEVTLTYRFPDRVRTLETTLLGEATVTERNGFTRINESYYEWDESTSHPTITLRYNPNATDTEAGPQSTDGEYTFVDAGEWALFPRYRTVVGATYTGSPVTVERQVRAAGQGVTSDRLVYLGDSRTYERTAHDQRFRLVVPEAAELREPPEVILNALTNASTSLRVGERDPEVLVVAAPTGQVEWGVRGRAPYGSEFWIRDSEPLDDADNVWIHEYIHTRQAFTTTSETAWLDEATADYYAALLTLEQGRIGFDEFRAQMARGEESTYRDVVLSQPSTYSLEGEYRKGALATARIDSSIRAETNGAASFDAVFRELNRGTQPVTQTAFLNTVAAAGGTNSRSTAAEYMETAASISAWDRQTHTSLYGPLPVAIRYTLDGYRVSGPSRTETVSATPVRVAAGETLTVDIVVRNTGTQAGDYNATLTVDGTPIDSATGELDAESKRTVLLSHTFEEPGEYTLGAGEETVTVVVEPADSEANTRTERPSPTPTSNGNGAGFTVPVAVVALLLAGVTRGTRIQK